MKELFIKWQEYKKKYPEVLILMRCNWEYYYTFGDDARMVVEDTGGELYQNEEDGDIEYTRFWYSAIDIVLPQLIRKGHRVAITDIREGRG